METEAYYEDIGSYKFDCTFNNKNSQFWLDRGMVQLYGFNQKEAISCFKKAIENDEKSIISYWCLGYAYGPHYNKMELLEDDLKNSLYFSRLALDKCMNNNEIQNWEKDLIYALQTRYPSYAPTRQILLVYLRNFSNAMKVVHEKYLDNVDIASFYVESIMNLNAWTLWKKDGSPTEEALIAREILEKYLPKANDHPGLCHLYIHLMELSPFFKEADVAGDILRTLIPASGHLLHMPSHLDILNGRYRLAIETNERALEADIKYQKYCNNSEGFYNLYILHNYHTIMYCGMFLGDYDKALKNGLSMVKQINEDSFNADPYIFESYLSNYLHVYVRFGKWKEILEEKFPDNPKKYPLKVAMLRYSRGVAYAALEQVQEAELEYKLLIEATLEVPSNWMVINNTAKDILYLAQNFLLGEIEYRKKNYDLAYESLREAVVLNDNLVYSEPWDWAMPPRHALGALLLEQDHSEEAYQVYLKDLIINPNNIWSLHGTLECMKKLNLKDNIEQIELKYENAKKESVVNIKSSCYCRLKEVQDI